MPTNGPGFQRAFARHRRPHRVSGGSIPSELTYLHGSGTGAAMSAKEPSPRACGLMGSTGGGLKTATRQSGVSLVNREYRRLSAGCQSIDGPRSEFGSSHTGGARRHAWN